MNFEIIINNEITPIINENFKKDVDGNFIETQFNVGSINLTGYAKGQNYIFDISPIEINLVLLTQEDAETLTEVNCTSTNQILEA